MNERMSEEQLKNFFIYKNEEESIEKLKYSKAKFELEEFCKKYIDLLDTEKSSAELKRNTILIFDYDDWNKNYLVDLVGKILENYNRDEFDIIKYDVDEVAEECFEVNASPLFCNKPLPTIILINPNQEIGICRMNESPVFGTPISIELLADSMSKIFPKK